MSNFSIFKFPTKANSRRNNYAKREKDGKRNFVLPRFLIVRPQFLLSGLLIKVRASTSGGPGFRFIVFLSALLATGHAIMRAGHLYFLLHFVTRRYLDRVFLDRAPWEPVTLWHLEKGRGWTVREKVRQTLRVNH